MALCSEALVPGPFCNLARHLDTGNQKCFFLLVPLSEIIFPPHSLLPIMVKERCPWSLAEHADTEKPGGEKRKRGPAPQDCYLKCQVCKIMSRSSARTQQKEASWSTCQVSVLP